MTNLNFNPIDVARSVSQRSGNSSATTNYLSIKEGETKGIRFLTPFIPTYVVSHSCGLQHIDMAKSLFEGDGQVLCPSCGQPIAQADIECERPVIEVAMLHRFIATSNPQKKCNFVCLQEEANKNVGLVEGEYHCPICSSPENVNTKTGNPKRPTMRLFGIAVERKMKTEIQTINGIPRPVTTEISDVTIKDENGNDIPKVVMIDMGYKSFWSQLYDFSPDYSNSLCYYDFEVSRTGNGLDTNYSIQCMNRENPTTIDMRIYEPYMPKIRDFLKRQADPAYFVKNGWNVEGYMPEQKQNPNEGVATAMGMMGNVMQQPAIQNPAGTISWSQIQSQIQG